MLPSPKSFTLVKQKKWDGHLEERAQIIWSCVPIMAKRSQQPPPSFSKVSEPLLYARNKGNHVHRAHTTPVSVLKRETDKTRE